MTSHWRVCRAGCGANPTQDTLQKNHGTPAEFARACWNAIDMVTPEEITRAIKDYEREWCNAQRTNCEP